MRSVIVLPTFNERENIEPFLRAVRQLDVPIDVLVVDDASPDGTADAARALAEELGVPLMGRIPLVPAMRDGADRGEPVVLAAPDSEAAAAFDEIAAAIVATRPRVRTHPELVIKSD